MYLSILTSFKSFCLLNRSLPSVSVEQCEKFAKVVVSSQHFTGEKEWGNKLDHSLFILHYSEDEFQRLFQNAKIIEIIFRNSVCRCFDISLFSLVASNH